MFHLLEGCLHVRLYTRVEGKRPLPQEIEFRGRVFNVILTGTATLMLPQEVAIC